MGQRDASIQPAVAPADWPYADGPHVVQFYEGDAFLVDAIARFLRRGFGRGEPGLVIATEPHRKELRRALGAAAADGRCVMVDAEETLASFIVGGWPDEARFSDAIGQLLKRAAGGRAASVCAFGEMVALLCAGGNSAAALRLEELWNEAGRRLSFSLLCAYPIRTFSERDGLDAFADVCRAHSDVMPTERYVALGTPRDRLRAIAHLQREAAALPRAERTLRQHQQELSDFLENAVEGLHRVGPDGLVLWANKAMLDLVGCSAEGYVGRHVSEFHADRETFEELWARLVAGESVYDFPMRLRRKDGSVRHVLVHSNARFEDGKLLYTRCFFRDVTERRRLAEDLEARCAELAEADRRKDEFLAMLGHELRNPLSAIRSAVATADLDSASRPRALEIAKRQVEQLARLIDDLLDVARITRGRIALRKERVDLADIVERAVEGVRRLMDDRGQRLVVGVSSDKLFVDADPTRLEQVIANLLTNAGKFTDVGGQIEVTAARRDSYAVLSVRDDGVGMGADLLARVFDLFTQGDRALDRSQGGLGIGLTIARRLVELHGGRIEARSEGAGKGSEFVVWLPLSKPPRSTASPDDSVPLEHARSSRARVLVVEDNRDAAEGLEMFLDILGHDVRVVHDGASALVEARRQRPDAMIVDIGLPGMDGYEIARAIRTDPELGDLALVALTGYGGDDDKQRALEAGFDHHLMKPVDPGALGRLVGELTGGERTGDSSQDLGLGPEEELQRSASRFALSTSS